MNYIDMLVTLGISSAHPGGFAATLEQLNKYPLPPGSRILDVGCGTGATACYLAEQGFQISAVDINEGMINKARQRAELTRAAVDFQVADVCCLPFPEEAFDIVLIESVTNFSNPEAVMSECYRVLKPGGVLYDRELMVSEDIPADRYAELKNFFELQQILNKDQWMELLGSQLYSSYEFLEYEQMQWAVSPDNPTAASDVVDEGAFLNPEVWSVVLSYDEIIENNLSYLFYGLIRAVK